MTLCKYSIIPEKPEHKLEIERLLDKVFGLSRQTKTSYRLREGETPVEGLSLVAIEPEKGVVGAISFWRVFIGESRLPALLLGPLAVAPERQGAGIGRALMRLGLDRAAALGARLVILVGDEPYYGQIGFRQVPEGRLLMPGPVDAARLLFLELAPDALSEARGLVLPPRRCKGPAVAS
ncbi:MAG TPA: N-acetyltransferase [Aestuariivirgaceae bacterium]|jgi:predicted N-acetyltransferase YhbS